MTIKELKEWFKAIPDKFDDIEIEAIDIDHTRNTDILNLVVKVDGKAVIKSLYREPNYIDSRDEV